MKNVVWTLFPFNEILPPWVLPIVCWWKVRPWSAYFGVWKYRLGDFQIWSASVSWECQCLCLQHWMRSRLHHLRLTRNTERVPSYISKLMALQQLHQPGVSETGHPLKYSGNRLTRSKQLQSFFSALCWIIFSLVNHLRKGEVKSDYSPILPASHFWYVKKSLRIPEGVSVISSRVRNSFARHLGGQEEGWSYPAPRSGRSYFND